MYVLKIYLLTLVASLFKMYLGELTEKVGQGSLVDLGLAVQKPWSTLSGPFFFYPPHSLCLHKASL